MSRHCPESTAILLFALAASPVVLAGQATQLPDMSAALQSRIDSQVNATLNRQGGDRVAASRKQAGSAGRGTMHDAASGSGRTDEPGWKPYHSAM